jgi:hypothetical protein
MHIQQLAASREQGRPAAAGGAAGAAGSRQQAAGAGSRSSRSRQQAADSRSAGAQERRSAGGVQRRGRRGRAARGRALLLFSNSLLPQVLRACWYLPWYLVLHSLSTSSGVSAFAAGTPQQAASNLEGGGEAGMQNGGAAEMEDGGAAVHCGNKYREPGVKRPGFRSFHAGI